MDASKHENETERYRGNSPIFQLLNPNTTALAGALWERKLSALGNGSNRINRRCFPRHTPTGCTRGKPNKFPPDAADKHFGLHFQKQAVGIVGDPSARALEILVRLKD